MTEAGTDPSTDHGGGSGLGRHAWRLGVGLVALGLVLRARGLSEYWLNPDEGIYYSTLTNADFGEFWAEVTANAHPPAFYVLLRASGLLTWDFLWLRATSLLFGVAAIWAFWLIGRELGGKGRGGIVAGAVAAGLLAVNGEAIALSQVLRPYMLLLALLAGALVHLLRYRSDPTDARLAWYVAFVSLALLSHYSAVLAFGVFLAVVGYYHFARVVEEKAWERLAIAQAVPGVVFAGLFVQHLASALGSGLVAEALDPGGWLSDWLIRTPTDAWHSFVTFQIFHLPPDFQGRSALLLLAAVAASVLARDRLVSVLVGSAVAGALVASALSLYPFGPSRHNTWLVLFTLPAVGWLVGHVFERGGRAALLGAGVLALTLPLGGVLEGGVGAYAFRTNATEERVIRRSELAPLVVDRLDPAGEPRVILMSFQTYNMLMPLYPSERRDVTATSDPDLFSFSYGSRDMVVVRRWDWTGLDDVREVVRTLATRLPSVAPTTPARVLLLAGGWGSSVFESTDQLERRGAIVDGTAVVGEDPLGAPILRLVGFVLDSERLGAAQ